MFSYEEQQEPQSASYRDKHVIVYKYVLFMSVKVEIYIHAVKDRIVPTHDPVGE